MDLSHTNTVKLNVSNGLFIKQRSSPKGSRKLSEFLPMFFTQWGLNKIDWFLSSAPSWSISQWRPTLAARQAFFLFFIWRFIFIFFEDHWGGGLQAEGGCRQRESADRRGHQIPWRGTGVILSCEPLPPTPWVLGTELGSGRTASASNYGAISPGLAVLLSIKNAHPPNAL